MENQGMIVRPIEGLRPVMEPPQVIDVSPQPSGPTLKIEHVPCFPKDKLDDIWRTIYPYVKELADISAGEYTPYTVYLELYSGRAILYVGRMDDAERLFVGYMIVRLEVGGGHVWQATIVDKYRHTNVFQMGADFIEKEMKSMSIRHLTFSAVRKEWGSVIDRMGFKETFTIYRKDLGEVK